MLLRVGNHDTELLHVPTPVGDSSGRCDASGAPPGDVGRAGAGIPDAAMPSQQYAAGCGVIAVGLQVWCRADTDAHGAGASRGMLSRV
jgi:hypothetical protein